MSAVAAYPLPGTPASEIKDPMVIGVIARTVGVNGEVKVNSLNQGCPECLRGVYGEITIRLKNHFRRVNVTHQSPTADWTRFKFEGVDSPEHAEVLRGAEVVIPWEKRPPKPNDEYYVDELIGCTVVSDSGEEVGLLTEVWHQGHHDLWMVDGSYGEVLIPAVKEYILSVNTTEHRITVRRVEGLWDES